MLRTTVALALAAVAYGEIELTTTMVDGNEHLIARGRRNVDLTDFEERINSAMANAQLEAERAAFNATLAASATLNDRIDTLNDRIASTDAAVNAQAQSMTAALDRLTASVNSQMTAMNAQMSTQLAAASTAAAAAAAEASTAAATAASEASTALAAGVSTAQAAATTTAAAIATCNARGQYRNAAGECVAFSPVLVRNTATTCNNAGHLKVHPTSGKIEVCDGQRYKASLPTVSHRGYDSSQGCENCYPGHRDISFRKHYADTYIRVMWYDNTRMYGWHGTRGTWHVRVCDANGNGCADCNDPGKMMSDKYTWAEHGWRTNLHHPQQVTALCRRTTNRQLNPGQYKIRLWLGSGRDAYTGHHGQYGSLQVEEVYKA